MKSILTITCHKVYNHGATLQEYALLEYLKSLGYKAETINYRPPYLSNHYNLFRVSSPRFDKNILFRAIYIAVKLPGRIMGLRKKDAFDAFEKKYVPVYPGKYDSNEALKSSPPQADIYICGSDQIWNSYFQNGKDPAFYLDFVPKGKLKISYAASFAIDEVADDLKPFVKKMVDDIDCVSVRESSGVRILERLGIANATRVLDPVFLIKSSVWQRAFVKPRKEKYIFVYDFDNNENIKEIARREAAKHGFKIFTVNSNITYADTNFKNEAPDAFVSLIYNAQFVITNSFHALAFSLIFNKKFCVINRTEKINTRMRDLLELAGLPQLLVSDSTIELDKINIDYDAVNAKVDAFREQSKNFLKSALEHDTKN